MAGQLGLYNPRRLFRTPLPMAADAVRELVRPDVMRWYRKLSTEVTSPTLFFALPKQPIVYLSVPKAACTTMAIETCESDTANAHWARMDRILPKSAMRIDFIGKVETLEQDLKVAFDRLETAVPIRRINQSKVNVQLPGEMRKAIAKAYHVDFERFDYPI